MKRLLIFVFTIISLTITRAQTTDFGVFAGVSLYSGDLTPSELGVYFTQLHPAGGVFARVNFSERFSGKLAINLGRVSGDDNDFDRNSSRRLSFRSDIAEVNLTGEINLFSIGNRKYGTVLVPFVYGGIGLFQFNPQTLDNEQWVDLQPLGTEGQGLPTYDDPYNLIQYNIPMGIGLKLLLNDYWTVTLEFGGRRLFTDYLDDISDTIINYQDVVKGNGEQAARLSNPRITQQDADITYFRGSPFNDWYYMGGITVGYNFSGGARNTINRKGQACPTF